MPNIIILIGMILWIAWGLVWILPLKLKLIGIHGHRKSNSFYIDLARLGDPLAAKVYCRTKIFIIAGLSAGALILFIK